MSWLEVSFFRDFPKTIPGAAELAVVTAINTIAHQRTEFFGNAVAEFNGQVGDTASCIHRIGCDDGLRGAYVDAFAAIATMVFNQLIGR